jgi:hypothetical protein
MYAIMPPFKIHKPTHPARLRGVSRKGYFSNNSKIFLEHTKNTA